MLVMKNDVSKITVVIAELASGTTNITMFGSNFPVTGILVDGTNGRFHTLNFMLKWLHFNSNMKFFNWKLVFRAFYYLIMTSTT
jgi:hypothetical protein